MQIYARCFWVTGKAVLCVSVPLQEIQYLPKCRSNSAGMLFQGGESWDALNTRLMRGLHRIHTAHPDEKVVAVVHGGVIGHLVAHATGAQPFAFNGADNGSITHLVMLGDLIKVRSFNDSTHVQRTLHDGSGQLT